MKKMNVLLKKCKSLSKLGRSSSYSSLRSKSSREDFGGEMTVEKQTEAVFVGSSRRRYMINAKLLDHPLLNALIEKSKHNARDISVKCEVVIFDHLLWMLENSDLEASPDQPEFFEELAALYAY